MKPYQALCLACVGAYLGISASIASVGWVRCIQYNGGLTCRSLQSDAMAGWSLAANVLQGIAFQSDKIEP